MVLVGSVVRSLLLLLLAGSLFLTSPRAWAQTSDDVHLSPKPQPVPAGKREADTPTSGLKPMRVEVDLVLVPVSVTDVFNRQVTGLQKDDFRLFEAGVPQQIRHFSNEEGPVSLGVILDVSRSMRDKMEWAREAVVAFLEAAHPEDDYFVVIFSDRPRLLADTTRSIGTIRDRLRTAEPLGRTALLDAIYLGVSKMRRAKYERRALLVISDGGDNRSRYSARELKRIVQEEDVQIYGLGIYDRFLSSDQWYGKRLLTQITEVTGGRTLTVSDPEKLPQMAEQISREIRNQYVIGYRPAKGPRSIGWRKIQVRLAQPAENLRVHSKRGYLGPGQ